MTLRAWGAERDVSQRAALEVAYQTLHLRVGLHHEDGKRICALPFQDQSRAIREWERELESLLRQERAVLERLWLLEEHIQ